MARFSTTAVLNPLPPAPVPAGMAIAQFPTNQPTPTPAVSVAILVANKQHGPRADGLIMTMTADNPKWSYVKLHDARVTEVVEKVVVSDQATVGIYNFARGSDFVAGADRMIAAGRMANGEYYVAPVYNELIDDAAEILTFNVGADGDGMYGLGIPADLEAFLTDPASEKALAPWR